MKPYVRLLFAALAIVAVSAWANHAEQPVAIDASSTTGSDVGYRVYLDPSTGEFTEPPATELPPVQSSSRSFEGLVEERSPVSGHMVNLQGRFQETMTATTDGENVEVGCGVHDTQAKEEE